MLVLAIGGCTIAELQERMSLKEFHQWCEFYRNQPFDDMHRYYRPAALVSGALGGGDIEKRLEWLCPTQSDDRYSAADLSVFKAFGFKPPKG